MDEKFWSRGKFHRENPDNLSQPTKGIQQAPNGILIDTHQIVHELDPL